MLLSLRGIRLGLEGPRVSRRIVAEELKICTGAAFIDLEQQAIRIRKVVFDERLINPLNIDIDSVVLVIQKKLGVIAAMRFDSLVTKNLSNNRLAENAAELNAIVKRNPPKAEETLVVGVLVEFDQKAPLVLLCGPGGAIAFEANRHVLNGNIPPTKGRPHRDPLGQRRPHALQVIFGDSQVNGLDFVETVEIVGAWSADFANAAFGNCTDATCSAEIAKVIARTANLSRTALQ